MKTFPIAIPDCNAPLQELAKVAIKHDVDNKLLEARLKAVYYIITLQGQIPRELIPEEISLLNDEDFLLQHDLHLEQRFSIVIDRAPSYTYHFSLSLSPDGRELYCRLHQGSKIDRDEKTIRRFFERIRIHKADMQVLIRDEKTEYRRLQAFVQSLPDEAVLSKPHEFLLAQSVGGVPCIEPHLKMQVTVKKGYQLINEGDLVATFHKGQSGEAARDCLGRFIPPQDPVVTDVLPLNVDDSIDVQEEGKLIKYYAKHTGYLSYEAKENFLKVTQRIGLKNVSLASTGHLLGGYNTSTHIAISCTDLLEDAVSEGVMIEAGTVEVIGNVGNKVIIRANKVLIKGQTHKGSQIFGDEVQITIHKGLVVGKTVQITRLEAGIVRGEDVKIDNVYGGKSYGENVKLITLFSNHKSYGSSSIVINSLKGEDNVLTICANAAPQKFERYKSLLEGKEQLIMQITDKEKQYTSEFGEVRRLQPLINQFKEEISKKQPSNAAKVKLIKEQMLNYKTLVTFLQQLKVEIDSLQEKLRNIENQISVFEDNINQAYISVKSGWKGYNKVRYKRLTRTMGDIVLVPQMNQDGPTVRLSDDCNALMSIREFL